MTCEILSITPFLPGFFRSGFPENPIAVVQARNGWLSHHNHRLDGMGSRVQKRIKTKLHLLQKMTFLAFRLIDGADRFLKAYDLHVCFSWPAPLALPVY